MIVILAHIQMMEKFVKKLLEYMNRLVLLRQIKECMVQATENN